MLGTGARRSGYYFLPKRVDEFVSKVLEPTAKGSSSSGLTKAAGKSRPLPFSSHGLHRRQVLPLFCRVVVLVKRSLSAREKFLWNPLILMPRVHLRMVPRVLRGCLQRF